MIILPPTRKWNADQAGSSVPTSYSFQCSITETGALGSDSKESACNAGDTSSIPGSGISPGQGNGNPLKYFCLENPWTEEPGGLPSMGLQRVRYN